MRLKQVLGVLLTLLGIAGLIYTAVLVTNHAELQAILIYGVLGCIFFFSGIGLIRSVS